MNYYDILLAKKLSGGGSGGEGIPVSPDSDTPIFFGVDATGLYMCTTSAEQTNVAFGREEMNVYAES
jgi:hypothetical protein